MNDENEAGMTMDFEPDDFKDEVIPPGTYAAVVAFATPRTIGEDKEYNPGDRILSVGYRITDDNFPELKGKLVTDFPYNREKGKNRALKKWFTWMGYNPEAQGFSFNPDDVKELPVTIRVGQKMVGKGADRHPANTIELVTRA